VQPGASLYGTSSPITFTVTGFMDIGTAIEIVISTPPAATLIRTTVSTTTGAVTITRRLCCICLLLIEQREQYLLFESASSYGKVNVCIYTAVWRFFYLEDVPAAEYYFCWRIEGITERTHFKVG
jgi:hypothetical protein